MLNFITGKPDSSGPSSSQLNDLVRKTVEETTLMMHKSKEDIDDERARLFEGSNSGSYDAEKVRRRAEAQLMRHTEEVGGYVKEVDVLIEKAHDTLER